MKKFNYNDTDFTLEKNGISWNISYNKADGSVAYVAANLFNGMSEDEAVRKGEKLVKSIFPVGVKVVGPDVAHPNTIGDLKIVGPDVTHPNFIHWEKNSSSFPKQIG